MKDDGKRKAILVVDDEEDLCWAFETGLEDDEFFVVTVSTGEAAVKEIEKQDYSVVIMDSKLPGMDGFEASRVIKETSPDTSIVVFSGYYSREDKEIQEGLKSGLFNGFLSKPFDFDEVKGIVTKSIESATK